MNEAVERAATCISRAIVEAQFTAPVLLEGMAGVYGPGGSWGLMRELADRIVRAAPIAEVGLTLDTAHAWARGYDFRDPGEVQRLVDNIDGTMGMEALRLVHLNDSKEDCGNGRDRHQHLGEGQIGRAGLGNVLAEPRIAAVPLIMETPWVDTETDVKNLQTALDLLA
jgi:deoxyribonuclease-4